MGWTAFYYPPADAGRFRRGMRWYSLVPADYPTRASALKALEASSQDIAEYGLPVVPIALKLDGSKGRDPLDQGKILEVVQLEVRTSNPKRARKRNPLPPMKAHDSFPLTAADRRKLDKVARRLFRKERPMWLPKDGPSYKETVELSEGTAIVTSDGKAFTPNGWLLTYIPVRHLKPDVVEVDGRRKRNPTPAVEEAQVRLIYEDEDGRERAIVRRLTSERIEYLWADRNGFDRVIWAWGQDNYGYPLRYEVRYFNDDGEPVRLKRTLRTPNATHFPVVAAAQLLLAALTGADAVGQMRKYVRGY